MELSSQEQAELGRRILLARTALLESAGFYGLLLMHMRLKLSDRLTTAWTDGESIYLNPSFIDKLSDKELAFVLQHEVLHVALRHLSRGKELPDHDRQNIAADIVVNSNILESGGGDLSSITLKEYGESMHLAPDGKEGRHYTMEEVYSMFGAKAEKNDGEASRSRQGDCDHGDWASGGANVDGNDGREQSGQDDEHSCDLGDSPKDGAARAPGGWDWHAQTDDEGGGWLEDAIWMERISEAARAVGARSDGGLACGAAPAGIRRALEELRDPLLDWKTLLSEFVQEEVRDFSFAPPDRRFSDSAFLLPDYNDVGQAMRGVLFLVDASGSVSDEELKSVFSEMVGAIEQFEGRMDGWVSFFDAKATAPERFEDVADLLEIKPVGGGGTSFLAAFQALEELEDISAVTAIVVLTDGFAPWPGESAAHGIPTLWVVNNGIAEPPWGRVARLARGR